MAQYDGSIRIGTKIDTSGFKQGEKELENETKNISKSVDKALETDAESLVQSTEKAVDELEKERKRLEELAKKAVRESTGQEEVHVPDRPEEDRPYPYTPGYNENAIRFIENYGQEAKITDEHLNQLRVDVEEYSKSLKELKDQGQFFSDEDYDKVYIAWKNAKDAVKEYQTELNQQTYTGQKKFAEQSEKEAARIAAAQAKEEARRAKEIAAIQAQEAEEERLGQIRVNAVSSNDEIISKVERVRQLESEIADLKKAGVTEGYKDYDERISELSKLKSEVKEYGNALGNIPKKFENMQKSAKKAFSAVSQGTKKSSGLLSSLTSRFKGLALSLLIFNQVSKAFNAMISGIKKGFENFAGYSDSYAQSVQNMKNAMSTLGNQFASAFAPIVQMVIPWLTSLVQALSNAMSYVAQFIAILSGSSTFTRAVQIQDKYNNSLNGTASAAKKALGALAKFDDLDVLRKQDNAGGGAGTEQTLPKDMFEEVPVDMKFSGWLYDIKEKLQEIKNMFSGGFWEGFGDFEYRWDGILGGIESIKNSLMDIWTDPSVISAADDYIHSLTSMFGNFAGAVTSIGLTIGTNLIVGISLYLEQNKERISRYLVDMFDIGAEINNLFYELSISIAYVFEAFASESGQQLTANIIGIFVDAFMGIIRLAAEVFLDIANIIIQPFVDNKEELRAALEEFLGVISEVTGTIKDSIDHTFDKLNEIYDAHFKPFFDSIANGLSDTVGKFLDFWNKYVQPMLDRLAKKIDEVWKEHIQPAIDGFINLAGKIQDLITLFWENVLKPMIDWIIINVLPVVTMISEGISNACLNILAAAGDVANGIFEYLGGIIDFLTGTFTGDWETAWNGIVEIFNGIWDVIKGIINGILGGIESMANGVIDGINFIIRALNNLSFDIPDWVPEFGGRSFGFDIKELSRVEIPKLASGAVIRGGNPFMAILGDQPAGRINIEAPLDTIKQAVREELSGINIGNNGGGTLKVVLNVNGNDLAQATLNDFLSEMNRQGYDVDVLGGGGNVV